MAEVAAVDFLARHSAPAGSFHSALQLRHRMKRVYRPKGIQPAIDSRWSLIPRQEQESIATSIASSTLAPAPSGSIQVDDFPQIPPQIPPQLPTPPPTNGINPPQITGVVPGATTSNRVAGTQNGAEAPAKTQKAKAACTPSPTKSLVPSASTSCLAFAQIHLIKVPQRGLHAHMLSEMARLILIPTCSRDQMPHRTCLNR